MATAESFKFAGILGAALEQHHLLGFEISSVQLLSRVRLFATPETVACQAPSSMGFPRQEYWNGLPFPSPGDLPHPGIELTSLVSVYNGIKTSVVAERS